MRTCGWGKLLMFGVTLLPLSPPQPLKPRKIPAVNRNNDMVVIVCSRCFLLEGTA